MKCKYEEYVQSQKRLPSGSCLCPVCEGVWAEWGKLFHLPRWKVSLWWWWRKGTWVSVISHKPDDLWVKKKLFSCSCYAPVVSPYLWQCQKVMLWVATALSDVTATPDDPCLLVAVPYCWVCCGDYLGCYHHLIPCCANGKQDWEGVGSTYCFGFGSLASNFFFHFC